MCLCMKGHWRKQQRSFADPMSFKFFKNWIYLNLKIPVMARAVLGNKGIDSGYRRVGEEGEKAPVQIFTILVSPRGLLLFTFQVF